MNGSRKGVGRLWEDSGKAKERQRKGQRNAVERSKKGRETQGKTVKGQAKAKERQWKFEARRWRVKANICSGMLGERQLQRVLQWSDHLGRPEVVESRRVPKLDDARVRARLQSEVIWGIVLRA